MRAKFLLCTMLFSLTVAATAYGATYTAQTIKITSEAPSQEAIDVTDAKIITDDFSFKIPEGWVDYCSVIQCGTSLNLYNKCSYDLDGSGLLFTITAYDNSDYQDLAHYTILGFRGNTTYVLDNDYIKTYKNTASSEYQSCKEAVKTLQKSFVSFVKE
ncbi:MAG: hypothetical protein RSE05_04230 [Clostridium sp.]